MKAGLFQRALDSFSHSFSHSFFDRFSIVGVNYNSKPILLVLNLSPHKESNSQHHIVAKASIATVFVVILAFATTKMQLIFYLLRMMLFQAAVELERFSTPTIIKDVLTVRSDRFTEVDQILDFIRKHISKSDIITGYLKREERWQYPTDALREIMIPFHYNRYLYTFYRITSMLTLENAD